MWIISPPGLTESSSFQTKPSLCKSVIIQKCRAVQCEVRRAAATAVRAVRAEQSSYLIVTGDGGGGRGEVVYVL